jgi:hypothetical protein
MAAEETNVAVEFIRYGVPALSGAVIAWVVAKASQSHEFEREGWKKQQSDIVAITDLLESFFVNDFKRVKKSLEISAKEDKGSEEFRNLLVEIGTKSIEVREELAKIRARCVLLGFNQEADVLSYMLLQYQEHMNGARALYRAIGQTAALGEMSGHYSNRMDECRIKLYRLLAAQYRWRPRANIFQRLWQEVESWRVP